MSVVVVWEEDLDDLLAEKFEVARCLPLLDVVAVADVGGVVAAAAGECGTDQSVAVCI